MELTQAERLIVAVNRIADALAGIDHRLEELERTIRGGAKA